MGGGGVWTPDPPSRSAHVVVSSKLLCIIKRYRLQNQYSIICMNGIFLYKENLYGKKGPRCM